MLDAIALTAGVDPIARMRAFIFIAPHNSSHTPSRFLRWPTIRELSPRNGPTGGRTPLTISGVQFGLSGYVTMGSDPRRLTIDSWVDTEIHVRLNLKFVA